MIQYYRSRTRRWTWVQKIIGMVALLITGALLFLAGVNYEQTIRAGELERCRAKVEDLRGEIVPQRQLYGGAI